MYIYAFYAQRKAAIAALEKEFTDMSKVKPSTQFDSIGVEEEEEVVHHHDDVNVAEGEDVADDDDGDGDGEGGQEAGGLGGGRLQTYSSQKRNTTNAL